ncbi:hypothetical protein CS053_15865 [Rhodanobacter glycinis]|uniref:Uncharacterized protein n=1 Tax=Rhodanobacter glycinis TaxID=582702 RepID=A0A5B9E5A7_9GAMM|nr:hypothetical protein [Rhodanobacter glycinis]QEE25820.1 hypothetical protein CS053_15865 [Rhodanobacter glycinis]
MGTKNWFVRCLIIALCLFLGAGIFYRFVCIAPAGDLDPGMLVVLALLVILVLSESFNNFSLGSLLSMSKDVAEKKAQVSDLKVENRELRSQVISIATTVSQRQTSTNILGLPQDIARMFTVTAAGEAEVEEKQADEQVPAQEHQEYRPARKRLDRRKLEQFSIERFLKVNELVQFPAVREAKLTAQMEIVDPVSTSSPIFDAYVTSLDAEIFIEVQVTNRFGIMSFQRDRLYVMLTKLSRYRALKKTNVFLALVLVSIPGEEVRPSQLSRLFTEFQPAISGGLLRIVDITPTEQEAAGFYEVDD